MILNLYRTVKVLDYINLAELLKPNFNLMSAAFPPE